MSKLRHSILVGLCLALLAAACGSDEATSGGEGAEPSPDGSGPTSADGSSSGPETLTLITHDSFTTSEGIFDSFTADTGIEVEVLSSGDAGEIVSRAVLTAGEPEGDVLFGIDNTFLQRGLDNDVFEPYESGLLDSVPDELELDPGHRVTPIDFGDVCVNYWIDALPGPEPTSLDDLTDPVNAGSFVTEHPETSSPGFAFLLATIATYGEEWESFWEDAAAGGLTVTAGWSEAYFGEFIAGGGDKAIVTSYAASPVAEVIFADPIPDASPTGVLTDGCFRQIEFAGVLAGTDYPDAAGQLIDFMLSPEFQSDIPLNMFVAPANADVDLPPEWLDHAVVVDDPLILDPATIEESRAAWTERWAEIVLG